MTAEKPITVHGTTVSINGYAVLIRGKPGSGKSDLALQLIESPGTGLSGRTLVASLVADDQTELYFEAGEILTRPPKTIAGKLEMRGVGILNLPHVEGVPLILVIDLKDASEIERMPDGQAMETEFFGKRVARLELDASKPSAAARLRMAWTMTMPRVTQH
jgi:HPr kinase/phosphorylase